MMTDHLEPAEFKKKGGKVELTVSVEYHQDVFGKHSFDTLKLRPDAAKQLVSELQRMLSWANHPVYKWAKERTK